MTGGWPVSDWQRMRAAIQEAYDMERSLFDGSHEDALSAATNAVWALLYRDPDSAHAYSDLEK